MNPLEHENLFWGIINDLKGVEQNLTWHPEGDAFVHTMQVVHHALRESEDFDLILAALLHDVGKAIHSYGHDNYGATFLEGFVSEKTVWLVRNHMRIYTFLNGEMKRPGKAIRLHNHRWFLDLVLLNR